MAGKAQKGGVAVDSFKHSFKNTLRENLGLAVYNTGYQKCDGQHTWGPATRDHYLVHYVSAGRGRFTCGGRTHALGAGDLFLIIPGQVAGYAAEPEDPWEYCWVGFHGADAKRLLTLTGFTREQPVMRPAQPQKLEELLLHIYRAGGNTPAADADMVGYLYLFLAELIRRNEKQAPVAGTKDYLAQAVRFIQCNYAGGIGVGDVAAYAGVSRSQLYRAFEAGFGLSPHDFLQRYRISQACSLLRSHRFTVAQVAGSVGYDDPLYFSRIFKKIKGMPPTDYPKSRGETTEDPLLSIESTLSPQKLSASSP